MHSEESLALLHENDARCNVLNRVRMQPEQDIKATTNPPRWMTTLFIAAVLIDLAIYGCMMRLLANRSYEQKAPLEIRDSYVGLDELYTSGRVNSSRHTPIISLPRRVGQVFRAHPHKTSPVDVHRWLSGDGTMSPTDEHLVVSADIRTVLQFRATDYGMESCQLALRLPSVEQRLVDPFYFRGVDGVAMLDVCEVDTTELIDMSKLTWASRPACKKAVGTLYGSPGSEVALPQFPCKTRTLYSYEITCSASNPDCLVDVWAEQNKTLGIYMYQHQTV